MVYIKPLAKLIKVWPGKRYLAEYRFLPIFFLGGAALEFSMIKWQPNGVNFYRTYKRNQVNEIADKRELKNQLQDIEIVVHPLKKF